MKKSLFASLLLFVPAAVVRGAVAGDRIEALPGWEDGELPSKMYSGFVDAGSASEGGVEYTMHENYFFVEAEGDKPTEKPVIVWTNGGPGASSYFGLFVELGPFYLSGDSLRENKTSVPKLFRNHYAWSKVANILIINSPPPVGYSYCDPAGPSGDGNSCGTWDDSKTAKHNAIYLENWLEKFPEFGSTDWFIIGESYAGVYVPTLVRELLGNPHSKVANLIKGMGIGDGCVGSEVLCGPKGPGPFWHIEFMYGHGQFSTKTYDAIKKNCPREQLVGFNGLQVTNKACKALLAQADEEVGGYYAYNLYDECWYQNDLSPPSSTSTTERTSWGPPPRHLFGSALNDYPCGGPQALFAWLEHPDVKEALHVSNDASFFSGDNGVGFTYNLTEPNLLPFYKHLVYNTSIRVLVYNGDTDPGINSFTAQNWTSFLGFPEKEAWRSWTLDSKQEVAGYVTRYSGDFDFLTIRGSGHMVSFNPFFFFPTFEN